VALNKARWFCGFAVEERSWIQLLAFLLILIALNTNIRVQRLG
jgi:hypothetical protein